MTDTKVGTKMRAHCSECRGKRNCEIRGHYLEQGDDANGQYLWWKHWYILTCCGCDNAFAMTVSADSEDVSYYESETGDTEANPNETIGRWPAELKRQRPDWFFWSSIESDNDTRSLDLSLRELYVALDNDLLMLAAIGMRTSFDVASELLGVDESLPFAQKIGELSASSYIRASELDHIKLLVEAGSASAHRGWKPTADELGVLMDILETFIRDAFVEPYRRRVAAEKIDKMRGKVPAKGKKGAAKQKPKLVFPVTDSSSSTES